MTHSGFLIHKYLRFLIILSATLLMNLSGVLAQQVAEKFEKLTVSENFDSSGTWWTIVSNAENLFIVQDGEYILQRRATSAPFAIIAAIEEEFSECRAVVSVKLDKQMGEGAHIGMLFMMQKEGQGGFLVEINKKREYRLRQIVGGSYRYISGSTKDMGWTRHNSVNEPGVANTLEVRTSKGDYDLYINNAYIRSFSEPNYRSGKLGLIIGPDSRGKADFFYVFTKGGATSQANNKSTINKTGDQTGDQDVIELAQSIISLKTRINELEDDNEGLRKTISAMKSGDQEKDVQIRNSEKQVVNLQEQMKSKDASIDSLNKVVLGLQRYKEMIGENGNGDVVINLSRALKTEKEKNQKLEEELGQLKEKTVSPKGTSPKSTPKSSVSDTTSQPAREPKKDSNVFSLPR